MKITIIADLVEKFEEKLQKFQRKFAKYGNGEIKYTKSEPYICKDTESRKYLYKVVDVEVEGNYKVGDYEFVASFDFNEETQMNLVFKAPETPNIPSKFVNRCECDHCKINRQRKHTVLLHNVNNDEYVQVGKACLHDYLGRDIVDYATYLGFFKDIEEYADDLSAKNGDGKGYRYFDVKNILTQTVIDARVRGYVSKATIRAWYDKNDPDGEFDLICPFDTTASRIYKMFAELRDNDGNIIVPKYTDITEEDKQQVEDVIAYVNDHKDDSDYIRNIYILITSEYVDLNNIGIVVSAVGCFLRETKKKDEKVVEESSEFVGEIGDKIEFTSKPEVVFSTDTQYGVYYIYKFMKGKDIIIWKTSKKLNVETELTLKGTVKEHNNFRGIKQTEITRAKIVA